jgi:hypothetical protein
MSTGAEQDIAHRLDQMLGTITPRPAPVEHAMRQGRAIRTRRRMTVAAGLAVAAAVAVAVPAALHAGLLSKPVSRPKHHVVTVHPAGQHSNGLIAYGTVDGKRWQIRAEKPGTGAASPADQCWVALNLEGCGNKFATSDPADLQAGSRGPTGAVYGPVAADVTYLRVALAGDEELTLHPVTAFGGRDVAFAAPTAIVTSVTAYSRAGEIATAIPLHTPDSSLTFATWLRPGRQGLPRATGLIGSGRVAGTAWSVTAYQGPWGRCLIVRDPKPSSTDCPAGAGRGATAISYTAGTPFLGIWQVAAPAAHVVITLTNGHSVRVPVVGVGTWRYFAFGLGKGVRPVRWTAYGSDRQAVGSGRMHPGF